MNKVIVSGNLANDPDLRFTPKKTAVCNFDLAVRDWKDDGDTLFLKCTAWAKTAEIAGKHLKKGSQVVLFGRLQEEKWETKEGETRKKIKLTVDDLEFAGKKPESSGAEEKEEDDDDDGLPF